MDLSYQKPSAEAIIRVIYACSLQLSPKFNVYAVVISPHITAKACILRLV